MVRPSPILVRSGSATEAVSSMHEAPSLRPIAGGTQVMADQGLGLTNPNGYLTLGGIEALRHVSIDQHTLRIGALVTLRDLQRVEGLPSLLAQALRALGTPQVRARATVGGNIAHPRPDHTLPPCLIALDARVTIVQKTGESTLTMSDLAAGGLPQGSLITGIEFAQPDGGAVFARVGPRNGPCYATAAIAVVVDTAARKVRTGLGGVGPNALGAPQADEFASAAMDWSRLAIGDDAIAAYAQAVRAACHPITDVTATAAYREHAITVLARRSLARACEGAQS